MELRLKFRNRQTLCRCGKSQNKPVCDGSHIDEGFNDGDDALALVLAVNSPELNVLAVTTVDGDVQLRGRIARKLLNLLGRKDIPVAAGCGRRFDGKEFAPYGVLGDHGFIETDQDGLPLVEEHAVDLMTRILQASSTKVTLVLLGPVTNAAEALKRYPAIKEKIERFVIMGGSIRPNGLLKKEGWAKWVPWFFKASMEHNLNVDQAAADLVLRSGVPVSACAGGNDLSHLVD